MLVNLPLLAGLREAPVARVAPRCPPAAEPDDGTSCCRRRQCIAAAAGCLWSPPGLRSTTARHVKLPMWNWTEHEIAAGTKLPISLASTSVLTQNVREEVRELMPSEDSRYHHL